MSDWHVISGWRLMSAWHVMREWHVMTEWHVMSEWHVISGLHVTSELHVISWRHVMSNPGRRFPRMAGVACSGLPFQNGVFLIRLLLKTRLFCSGRRPRPHFPSIRISSDLKNALPLSRRHDHDQNLCPDLIKTWHEWHAMRSADDVW